MKITVWGARGSIAVAGPEYVRYGGDTTCLELRDRNGDLIIVDAGTGIRRLGNRLIGQGPLTAAILFTHAHWDHVVGFPFFKPVYSETTRLKVICCAFTHRFVSEMLGFAMAAPYFPVPFNKLSARIEYPEVCQDRSFGLGNVQVEPIALSHPNGCVGYKFLEEGRSFVFMTDNELGHRHPNGLDRDTYVNFCRGADLLIHDAEYTPAEYPLVRGYGHSTYVDALGLALEAGVRRFGIFHHNQERSDDGLDAILADARRRVEEAGADLEVLAMAANMTLEV